MFKKILVVIDDQPASMQAILQGVEVAQSNGGEILFFYLLPNLNMLPPVAMQAAVIQRSMECEMQIRAEASALMCQASSIAEAAGVMSFRAMGRRGSSNEAKYVADVAAMRGCQLIVVGTACRNALVRLLGTSIIPSLISIAKVPVLVCQFESSTGHSGSRNRNRSYKHANRNLVPR